MRPKRNLLFSGPTLHRALAMGSPRLLDVVVLPPVQRGDVDRIVQSAGRDTGVMIICDGFFHLKTLAVGHAEIRNALRRGWIVWGLSSMGAIRACEMRHMGMRGYGECFEAYCADPEFRDDEVALLHESDPPYREASEPLIHMRRAVAHLCDAQLLSAEAGQRVIASLYDMWFGDRTLALLVARVAAEVPEHEVKIRDELRDFDRFRSKAKDLL